MVSLRVWAIPASSSAEAAVSSAPEAVSSVMLETVSTARHCIARIGRLSGGSLGDVFDELRGVLDYIDDGPQCFTSLIGDFNALFNGFDGAHGVALNAADQIRDLLSCLTGPFGKLEHLFGNDSKGRGPHLLLGRPQ